MRKRKKERNALSWRSRIAGAGLLFCCLAVLLGISLFAGEYFGAIYYHSPTEKCLGWSSVAFTLLGGILTIAVGDILSRLIAAPGLLFYILGLYGLRLDPPAYGGMWILFGLIATVAAATCAFSSARRGDLDRRGKPSPFCARCGYPLHGLTKARCPECGKGFPAYLVGTFPPPTDKQK